MNFKQALNRNILNIPGWRTNRKIVVIESDDWGSVRMPSKKAYNALFNYGVRVDKCPYNSFDSLETSPDLIALYDVLNSFKDKNGNPTVMTANSVVANPDFDKIRESGFKQYHYERVLETFNRYNNGTDTFSSIEEGVRSKVFFPQFHGREHLNVLRWMAGLASQCEETHFAFNHNVFGVSANITTEKRGSYLAALDYRTVSEEKYMHDVIDEGLTLFNEIYGYKSASFIAPNYTWGDGILAVLKKHDVTYIQGSRAQNHPQITPERMKKINHKLGDKNDFGQIYLVRNCFFEPSIFRNSDIVGSCLKSIDIAFRWRKPAIISSHRLNFMSGIDENNRNNNLMMLRDLLSGIVKKWPDVEFMTSVQLGDLITGKYE